jgi:hypothetical protein
VVLKFENHHRSPLPHSLDSLDIIKRNCWLFGMLKVILKDREFDPNDEIDEAVASRGMVSFLMTCRLFSATSCTVLHG